MKVITLSREYGAGGHSIGRKVATELGIEFYDRDIIKGVALESGIDPQLVEADNEEISRADTFIRTITPISYDQKDSIFKAQKSVVLDIASKGPCVILGRCADAILSEAGIDSFNVFLYGDMESREKRVGELINSDNVNEIRKTIKRIDHNRHSYYTYYTDKHWGDYRNYNLMIDTGAIGYEAAVKMIVEAVKNI